MRQLQRVYPSVADAASRVFVLAGIFILPAIGYSQPNNSCTPECNIPQPFSQCSFTIPTIAPAQTVTGYCGNSTWASVVTWNPDPQDIQNDVKIVGSGTITIPASNNLILKSAKTIHLVGVCLIIEAGNLQFDNDNAKFVLENGALILEGTVGSGSIQLSKNGNVFYSDNSLVQVENGNIQVASGADNRFIFNNGTLRTFGDFNQDGDIPDPAKTTTVCISNSVVEIGDEGANGKFNSTTNQTSSANWTNIGGQRYLEDVCLNVTENFQLQGGGEDRIVDVCAEIGDQDNGSNNGHHYGNLGILSNDETGNFQNDEGTSHIYHSSFIVAQNIQFGTGTTKVCDVDFANLNGSFQVQSGHLLSGCGLCLWIVNGNIQSAANSNWTATVFGHILQMSGGTNFLTTSYGMTLWENGQNQSGQVPNCFSSCCSDNPACDLNIHNVVVSPCNYNTGTNTSEATLSFTVSWLNSQCGQNLTVTVKNSLNQIIFTETISSCGINSKNYSITIPSDGTTGSIMASLGNDCMTSTSYIAPPPCPPGFIDYGDLPDGTAGTGPGDYQTFSANNGACHTIVPNLKIGATVDAEADGQPSALADGDGADEDGIPSFPTFIVGQVANVTVSVMNMTGSAATLYGFIDWNNDGDFLDASESTTVAVPNGTNGNVTLVFTVPGSALKNTNLGARFRLSTQAGLTAVGCAPDGEVEDYLVQAVCPTISIAVTQTNVLCFGASTGAIDITASGGTPAYNYDWADIAGTNNAEDRAGLSAGTYTVTVTDANGCTTSTSVTITQPASGVTVSATQTNVLCFGASAGAIDITASGGTPAYTYDWADIAGTNNMEDRAGLPAGTYTVTVTDANGCTTSTSVTITQPASGVTV
ncbi:MAG: SprB repeat-containing protein, partial [Saprospiraceae bacterium]|nr:SprB repeat-containing protein [Saprospiraceae bacterium]